MQLQHSAARARACGRAPSRRRVTVVATAVTAQKSVSGRMAELKAQGK